jgi:hypothetical protein
MTRAYAELKDMVLLYGWVEINNLLWLPFNAWSNCGFKIIKGSKSSKIDNKNMFSHKQVVRYTPATYLDSALRLWADSDYDGYEHF